MPKISTLNEAYPTNCETLLQLRAECADHVYFLNSGYINYYINETFKPYEHRLVAEMVFGEIPNGYQVHHINRIRSDNRASNLELLNPSEHAHHHHGIADISLAPCAACGRILEVRSNRLERNEQFYCNRKCVSVGQRKTDWPTPAELSHRINEVRNWKALGRIYGVSDNAVRRWARSYGLPVRK